MKKQTLFIALFFIIVVCCSKEYDADKADKADKGRFEVCCEIEPSIPETKTELISDSTTVVWQSDDRISFFSASGDIRTFYLTTGNGTTSATFSGEEMGTGPYYAFYPAAEGVRIDNESLYFHLSETQEYVHNSFGVGASPMVTSKLDDLSQPLQFRNLSGLLCLRLSAKPSFRVSKLVIKDLAGNMLWGDCLLHLDGTQGTSAQTMEITNGSDEITLQMSPPRLLPESAPMKIYIAIPPGALKSGFTATVYDEYGEVITILKTVNTSAVIERSKISNMTRLSIRTEPSDSRKRGYYKDLFMDSGISLVNRSYLQSAEDINWDYEYQAPQERYSTTDNDRILQRAFFEYAEDDENGYLLYPDRQPRYRCIYVNGGSSVAHGKSLGANGRKSVYDFVYNGGSYVGTCAGAFLASKGYDTTTNCKDYFQIFPGHMYHTIIKHDRPDMLLQENSPLLAYGDFGDRVHSVMHSNGGYLSEEAARFPEGTEILLRYGVWPSGTPSDEGKVGCWAYKPNEKAGRIVCIGSHPEYGTGDKRNDFRLFAALLQYAADGHGDIPIKATLLKGEAYACTALSSANTPAHARIGDKQYHHFKLEIPEGAEYVTLTLESEFVDDDLYLSLRKDDYAWFSEADYTKTSDGSNKVLKIRSLEAGTYYVSVYAPNTVVAELTSYDTSGLYYKYSGKTHLLNGIPYTLTADWKIRNDKDGGNENFKGQDDLGDDFEFEFD